MKKIICPQCDWHGKEKEALTADHPFITGIKCYGCPDCLEIVNFFMQCDEPGCLLPVSCGTPTTDEYRLTCGKHKPGMLRAWRP